MIVLNGILYYCIILPISLFPFRLLYVFSDFLFLFIYRISGYRKKVVRQNLKNAFPDKTADELKEIEIQFYHHLCDIIVETIKSFSISSAEITKRMVIENPELVNQYYHEGKSVLLAGGHYNNWEWTTTSIQQQLAHRVLAVYTPLSNPFYDKKMLSTRSKFGLNMISYRKILQYYSNHRDLLTASLLAIDQSPRNPKRCYWTTFLRQETGIQIGIEKFARKLDFPVLFGRISKIKRGFYSIRFSVVCNDPRKQPHGSIIESTTHILEQQIRDNPQYWLWSHRRWKHKHPPENHQWHKT
jgi:KDO2-lipid IV(A) lauroyltransferase